MFVSSYPHAEVLSAEFGVLSAEFGVLSAEFKPEGVGVTIRKRHSVEDHVTSRWSNSALSTQHSCQKSFFLVNTISLTLGSRPIATRSISPALFVRNVTFWPSSPFTASASKIS